ncbi:MAG: hypothetical protein CVT73_20495 [Alphaproteobacteria bacterium HGW-Alphaproteobacteria-12]|nr:MAG: hypothetical protein CVT73_20495 [Alphaproteobacteria bacterium HGW-Alphaproteobacteria-12]
MRPWRSAVLLFVFLFAASPAGALERGLAEAQSAFDAGNFAHAATLARKLRSAKGDALALRAEMVRGEFLSQGDERRRRFEAGLADARRAVMRGPDIPEAHLAVAVGLGLIARRESGIKAHFDGLGTEARNHIDRALAIDDGNAWAHAALGGWHLEIVHEGGVIGAAIYGASVRAGIDAYDLALVLDPDNVSIAWQCAFQLAGLGGAANRARAEELLDRMLAREPRTALEGLLRKSALPLKEALRKDDRPEIARLVAMGLGRRALPPGDGIPAPGKR